MGGSDDGFFASFDLSQTGANSLISSSYFGGTGSGYIKSVDVDSSGNIYVAGLTNSTDLATVNAYQASNGGNYDVFAAKFNSGGNTLLYSTYLGGSAADYAEAIAVDNSGNMYVGGRTSGSFITTAGAYDTTFGAGSADGFIAKIDSTQSGASSLIYSTYLGGSGFDYVIGLDIDDSGNAYLAGFSDSSAFPTTVDGNDRIMTGSNDGFFSVLNATGTSLTYSTFIGGTGQDRAKDVVWNTATGSAYVGGQNEFPDGPTSPTPTVLGPTGGGKDAYVAKFAFNQAPVNTVPGTQMVPEETSTAIGGISISDDAAGGNLTTRLQVTNGVLNVTLSGSASISAGANGTGDLTILGTVTDINATLSTLTYTGDTDVVGTAADTLTVTTTDSGALQDVDNIQIDITAVNDTPIVNGPGSAYSATEQVGLSIEGTGFTVSDVDAAAGTMTATLVVGEGTATVSVGDSGVTISSGNGTGTVTLTGTLSQLDNLLTGAGTGTITYLNNSDTPSASTTITVTVNDGGNTGADPGLTGDGSERTRLCNADDQHHRHQR